jgi:hypothetical protein
VAKFFFGAISFPKNVGDRGGGGGGRGKNFSAHSKKKVKKTFPDIQKKQSQKFFSGLTSGKGSKNIFFGQIFFI